jgi:WD40 repeat protein
LRRVTALPDTVLEQRVERLGTYVRRADETDFPTYRLVNQSLQDWLTNSRTSGPYFADEVAGHNHLCDALIDDWRDVAYGLHHLPAHLIAAERWKELVDLLTDFCYLRTKIEKLPTSTDEKSPGLYSGVHAVQDDYVRARAALPPAEKFLAELLSAFGDAFAFQAHLLAVAPEQTVPQLYAALAETHTGDGQVRKWAEQSAAKAKMDRWLRQVNWCRESVILPVRRTFSRHNCAVTALALCATRSLIASGDKGGVVQLWNVETGEMKGSLPGHRGEIRGLAFSADGNTLCSADASGGVRVWNCETQKLLGAFMSADLQSIILLDVSNDLVVGQNDRRLFWWNLESLEVSHIEAHAHDSQVLCMAASPDGKWFVSGDNEGIIRMWDTSERVCTGRLSGHTDRVECLAVSPNADRFASGSRDRSIAIWDAKKRKRLHQLTGHSSKVNALCFLRAGSRLLSASYDTTVRLWDPIAGTSKGIVGGHKRWIHHLEADREDRYVVSGGEDREIKVWSPEACSDDHVLEGHSHWVLDTVLLSDERQFVSVSRDKTIHLWQVGRENAAPKVLKGHKGWVQTVCLGSDSGEIFSGSNDRSVRRWTLAGSGQGHVLRKLPTPVRAVTASSEGQWIAAGGQDGHLECFDEKGQRVRSTKLRTKLITDLATTPDGECVLVRCIEGSVRLLCANSLKQVRRFRDGRDRFDGEPDLRHSVTTVGCSADSRYVYSGDADGSVRIWPLQEELPIVCKKVHSRWVRAVCVLPDNQSVVTGGEDGIVVWNLNTGERFAAFNCGSCVSSISYLSESNWICAIDSSVPRPRVRIFRLETRSES